MRLLNDNNIPVVGVQAADPRMALYNVRGRYFAVDTNSLSVVQLDRPEQFDGLAAAKHAPYIGACYRPKIKPMGPRPKALSLVLHTTQTCNLECSYCFIDHEYVDGLLDTRKGRMTIDVARRAIDELLDWTHAPHLGFFGGEPTLNWDLIVEATEHMAARCREHGHAKPGQLSITTNGTRLTPERAKWLAEKGFSLIVSIDGTKASQDRNRPHAMPPWLASTQERKGSYEEVLSALRMVRDVAPALSRRITLRGTFPWYGRPVRLVEDLRAMTALVDEGLGHWASLEPAILTESCAVGSQTDQVRFAPERVFDLAEEYLEKADFIVERMLAGKPAYHHQILKFVERMLYSNHAWSECGAGVGYMSVDAQGAIYACHRQQHSFIGHLDTGVDEALRAKWTDNSNEDREECRACNLTYVCGGGCREESVGHFVSNEGMSPDEAIRHSYLVMCNFKELWMRAALWVMSEVPKHILKQFVWNPQAKRLDQIKQEAERRRKQFQIGGPSNEIVRKACAGCDAC